MNQTDDFCRDLFDSVDDQYKKLRGKPVPVNLSLEETKLIEWALRDFELLAIIQPLNEIASSLSERNLASERTELYLRVEQAFEDLHSYQKMLKALRFKINEALDIAVHREESEPGLNLESN